MVEYIMGAEPVAISAEPYVSLSILIVALMGLNVTRHREVAMDAVKAA